MSGEIRGRSLVKRDDFSSSLGSSSTKSPGARPGLSNLPGVEPAGAGEVRGPVPPFIQVPAAADRSEPVENLVGPEPLEPLQRLVETGELRRADAAHLLDRAHMLVVQRLDDV